MFLDFRVSIVVEQELVIVSPEMPRGRQAAFVAAMLLGFLVCLTLSIAFRGSSASKAFFPCNGFLVVLFMSCNWRVGVLSALIVIGEHLSVTMGLGGRTFPIALTGALNNVGESWAAALICKRLFGDAPDFTRVRVLAGFTFLGVVPAVTAGAVSFDIVHELTKHNTDWTTLVKWVTEDSVGIVMVAPALWIAIKSRRDERRAVGPPFELPMLMGLLVAGESILFMLSFLPALFLLFPVMIYLCFRHGRQGAATAVLLTNFLVFGFAVAGQGPLAGTIDAGQDYEALLQALFVMAITFTALPVAGAIEDQFKLRTDLAMREQQALKAAEAKADFLATMSHELRTPLHSIISYSDILSKTEQLNVETARKLRIIQDASKSLLTVVDDILDFSKIEAGAITFLNDDFDVVEFAQNSVDIVAQLAERKGLALRLEVGVEAQGRRIGDAARLRQIALNLLNNAIKFTATGSVSLTVRATNAERLRFEVVDTGVGIAPDAAARLFQRFQQADNTVSRSYGGTGLGLAISRMLVEQMGGQIGVDSAPGAGATFWFEVPLPRAQAVDVAPDDREAQIAQGNVRILLVDDVAANREIGSHMLSALGCEVSLASGGVEAVEHLRRNPVDLVFMDVHMPLQDGLKTTQIIRREAGPWASVPIVAMTANVQQEQVEVCLAAGMDGHIGKPFSAEDLVRSVNRHLFEIAA